MIISYIQNLHFKIQCREIQKQDYNSLHYIFDTTENWKFTQWYEYGNHSKSLYFIVWLKTQSKL
jgi:hypothetical protein